MAYGGGYGTGYSDSISPSPPVPTGPCLGPFGYGTGFYAQLGYGGYYSCPQSSTTPDAPASNVLNIDDFQGRLGCGVASVFLTRRCASSGVLCVLDAYVVDLTWGRKLDDVSEAEVVCQFGGEVDFACCECLAEAEPWCTELHVWRDGAEVWVGPVQTIEYAHDTVTVTAKDSLAWLDVRIPPGNIDYTAATGLGATDLSDIAEDVLNIAFASDAPTFTCEIDNLYKVASGEVSERFFEEYSTPLLEILFDLADTGLNVTTLGRTIVLVGDDTPLVPLILLNDEHIIGDIKVLKDGQSQGNRYYVHFDGDGGIPALSEATDFYCYGAIERLRDGDGLYDGVSAGQVGDAYVKASAIAPRRIEIPDGSRLSPDTPWTINQMVPGTRVDVAVTRMCLNLTQSFILTGITVKYSSGNGEEVGITLTPINDVAVA